MLYTVLFLYFSFPLCSFALIYCYFFIIIIDKLTISFTKFKNASAFLLRDARHAKHDILLLRILSNPAGGYIRWGIGSHH